MAGNTPNLTNENYHMFGPSMAETTLLPHVGDPTNPMATSLLNLYRADREGNQQNYQGNIDEMHRQQLMQAAAANRLARGTQLMTSLKDFKDVPGAMQAMISGGFVDPSTDLSRYTPGVESNAAAVNMEHFGRGAGNMMMAGTNLQPQLNQQFPGAVQDPNTSPMAVAAGIKAAAHGTSKAAVDKTAPTFVLPVPEVGRGAQVTVKGRPGESPKDTIARGMGSTSLPRAPNYAPSGTTGRDNPLLGPMPNGPTLPGPRVAPGQNNRPLSPSPLAAPQNHSAVDTLRGLTPQQQQDVLLAASSNGNNYKIVQGTYGDALMGASGNLYPLGGQG